MQPTTERVTPFASFCLRNRDFQLRLPIARSTPGPHGHSHRVMTRSSSSRASSGEGTPRAPDRRRMHRIDWAELLRRIHRVDALACPRCERRLAFIAAVTERDSIRQVLEHLGESPTGPPPVRIVDAWVGS